MSQNVNLEFISTPADPQNDVDWPIREMVITGIVLELVVLIGAGVATYLLYSTIPLNNLLIYVLPSVGGATVLNLIVTMVIGVAIRHFRRPSEENPLIPNTPGKPVEQPNVPQTPTIVPLSEKVIAAQNSNAQSLQGGGNKYNGLRQFETFLAANQSTLPNVCVPESTALFHEDVEPFLRLKCPEVFTMWCELQESFQTSKHPELFLSSPDVAIKLKKIQTSIESAFTQDTSYFSKQLNPLLSRVKKENHFLMVRSSGNEDSKEVVNAGGNLSESYVQPELSVVSFSCGRVLASYFDIQSLKNQMDVSGNPFNALPQLSVMVQELIGESPASDSQVPVSAVLLTSEPDYSEGQFRVTTVACSYGHGEAVVKRTPGVSTDTLFLTRTPSKPHEVLGIYRNQTKHKRLAPAHFAGAKTELVKKKNQPELTTSRCITEEMATQLRQLATQVEQHFKEPMDMELVIQGGKIYVVQMRPLSRVNPQPGYLAYPYGKNNHLNAFSGKMLVLGDSNVHCLTSKDSIKICDSLETAEREYVKGQHQLIIVKKEEENTHFIQNFKNKGIPCVMIEDHEELLKEVESVSTDKPLIVCTQTGRLFHWKDQEWKSYQKAGYANHPAPIDITIDPLVAPYHAHYAQQAESYPKDLHAAIALLNSRTTDTGVLITLEHIRNDPKILEIGQKIQNLQTTNLPDSIAIQIEFLKGYVEQLQSTFNEIKFCHAPNNKSTRLEKLFHIKCLSTLLGVNINGKTMPLSLMSVERHLNGIIEQINSLKDNPQSKWVDWLHFGDYAFNSTGKEAWKQFLSDLEKVHLPPQSINDLEALLKCMSEGGCAPLWLHTIFLPLTKTHSAQQIAEQLIADFRKNHTTLLKLLSTNQKISKYQPQLSDFEDPTQFDAAWKKMQKLVNYFASDDFLALLDHPSVLVKTLSYELMNQFTDHMDLAIKNLRGSQKFDPKSQVEKFGIMLQVNYNLMKKWTEKAIKIVPFKYGELQINEAASSDIKDYFALCEQQWVASERLAPEENLQFSPSFSVAASKLGTGAQFTRHLPHTKDDFFTLYHQNQKYIISRLHGHCVSDDALQSWLPDAETSSILSQFKKRYSRDGRLGEMLRTGVSLNQKELRISYTIPLQCHSLELNFIFNHQDYLLVESNFYGKRGDTRWAALDVIAGTFHQEKVLDIADHRWTNLEYRQTTHIRSNEDAEILDALLSLMVPIANQHRFSHSEADASRESWNNLMKDRMREGLSKIDLKQPGIQELFYLDIIRDTLAFLNS